MDRRLVILGIDGMDFDYATSFLDELPELRRLSERGAMCPFESVFPPDSIPAWITCYTGLDPSEHGILESIDYLAKGDERVRVGSDAFKGKTFWDVLSAEGRTVTVINPFLAYPAWDVNGAMISGPVFIDGQVSIMSRYGAAVQDAPDSFGGIVDFPQKSTLRQFIDKTWKDTMEQAEFGLAFLRNHESDLFFQTFLTMDRMQHFLWRYCDPADPTHPGPNAFSDSIGAFYKLIDKVVGRFLDELRDGDELMLISDHGHCMRCTHCFHVNEFLRRRGDLKSRADGKVISFELLLEKLKNCILAFANDHDLYEWLTPMAKIIPNARAIKKGNHITSDTYKMSFVSDFSGTNPFGGICINREKVSDYDGYRADLMAELSNLRHKDLPVFQWIVPREEVYHGPFINKFPDILFCMQSHLGVAWNLHGPLITVNPTHKKVSGGHNRKGIFASTIVRQRIDASKANIGNFHSTVLHYFGTSEGKYNKSKSFIK